MRQLRKVLGEAGVLALVLVMTTPCTYSITKNTSGCNEVRARVKLDGTHFGSWMSGGSGTAIASTVDQAIGGSHQRCTTCTTYAT